MNRARLDRGNEVIGHVDPSEVGRRARKGALWGGLQIGGRQLISIGSTAILARHLSPTDYGLIGMVATLTALLQMFADMGLSWSTLQRPSLTRFQLSNLFWANLGAGILLWGVCLLLAPWIADFYQQPELVAVVQVMGASFLLASLGVQPIALMQRQMRFREVALVEIMSLVIGVSVGISGALLGFAYWSLVAMSLTTQLVRALLAFWFSGLMVFLPRRGVGTRALVSVGGLLVINGIFIYLSRNADSVMVGKWWGADALGYYNRAYFLMLLPTMLATGVLANLMVPSLAAFQSDRQRFGNAYRRAVVLVALVGSPMAAGLALTADEAVRLVYGAQWSEVAGMLQWLSLAGVTSPIFTTVGWLFTAVGKAKSYLQLTFFNAVMLICGFYIAVPHGALAVAVSYGLVMGLGLVIPALWWAHRAASLRLRDTLVELWPVFLSVAIMAAAVALVGYLAGLADVPWLLQLVLKMVVGVIVYVTAVAYLVPRSAWGEFLGMLKTRFKT